MKRFGYTVGFVGFLLLVIAFPLHAQQAEVTHNVNLRADPSTDNPPIRLLMPPEQVQLLEPDKTAGYTVVVIIVSIFFGLYLFALDFAIDSVVLWIFRRFGAS